MIIYNFNLSKYICKPSYIEIEHPDPEPEPEPEMEPSLLTIRFQLDLDIYENSDPLSSNYF